MGAAVAPDSNDVIVGPVEGLEVQLTQLKCCEDVFPSCAICARTHNCIARIRYSACSQMSTQKTRTRALIARCARSRKPRKLAHTNESHTSNHKCMHVTHTREQIARNAQINSVYTRTHIFTTRVVPTMRTRRKLHLRSRPSESSLSTSTSMSHRRCG